jgi:hypothetical protein
VGTAFAYQITASESPTSFVALDLPAGLSVDPSTGAIGGTPTASGSFTVILRAANVGGLGAPANLAVTMAPAVNAPVITSASSVTGRVGVALTYTTGAAPGPIRSYLRTGTLPLGLNYNTATGVLAGNPAESGLFVVNLSATNDGGTSLPQQLVLSIAPALGVPVITSSTSDLAQVGTPYSYTITATNLPAAPPYAPPNSLEAVNLPPGLAVNPAMGLIQGTPTAAGTYVASLVGTNAAGQGATRDLTIVVQPALSAPVINSGTEASGQVGVAFSYLVTATNSPTAYEVLGAPAWMTTNSLSGAISGLPAVPGSVTVQLVASNAAGSSSPVTLTLNIAPAAGAPVITSTHNASGNIGSAFTYSIVASTAANATTYVAQGLPAGLALNATTGVISGSPTASGTYAVTLSAVFNPGGGAAALLGAPVTLTITIQPSLTLLPGS